MSHTQRTLGDAERTGRVLEGVVPDGRVLAGGAHILGDPKRAGRALGDMERAGRVLQGAESDERVWWGMENPKPVLRNSERSEQPKERFPSPDTALSPDELRMMAKRLQTLNRSFLALANLIQSRSSKLKYEWRGQAWDAFQSCINDHLFPCLRFHDLIERYANALNYRAAQKELALQRNKKKGRRS